MLGKEHVLSTIIFAITFVYILIFQKFLVITNIITPQQMIFDIISLPNIDYIYIFLLFIAMVIASTSPDVDVEQPTSIVRKRSVISSIWFTIVKYIAYLPMTAFFTILGDRSQTVGHRKIFHSIYGAIAYTISIVIIFIIILTSIFFIISSYKNITNNTMTNSQTTNSITTYVGNSVNIIKYYWDFVLIFLIGSFIGFMAHLFEDSLTVSGIVYLPFITNIGLKGRLKTGSEEFYTIDHTNILRQSKTGMVMIWMFNILFIFGYSFFNLYLLNLLYVFIIYFVGIFIFLMITAGLKPSYINRK